MDYIEGRNLEQVIQDGESLSERSIREWAKQILDVTGYLHENKFLHGDIKPSNLILTHEPDGNDRIVLIDLGLVKSQSLALNVPYEVLERVMHFTS